MSEVRREWDQAVTIPNPERRHLAADDHIVPTAGCLHN
jgi:hypothetical protein